MPNIDAVPEYSGMPIVGAILVAAAGLDFSPLSKPRFLTWFVSGPGREYLRGTR